MGTKNSNTSQELFNLNGKPSFGQALPLAFQHVVAMIIGCVAPAIIPVCPDFQNQTRLS